MPRQTDNIERRTYGFEVRAVSKTDAPVKLEGYAAVFNRETVLIPRNAMWDGSPEVREVIAPGAFTKTLKEADYRAVWNHNTDIVLGRKGNQTARGWEDSHGLGTEIIPPDTQLIRDMVIAPIERGDVNQMSFAFQIIKEDVEEKRTEKEWSILYTLREIRLIEVSPVAIPAYDDTEIGVSARSRARMEDFAKKLRDASIPEPEHHSDINKPAVAHSDPEPEASRHLDAALSMRLEIEKATA